jgi:hypothetical protein
VFTREADDAGVVIGSLIGTAALALLAAIVWFAERAVAADRAEIEALLGDARDQLGDGGTTASPACGARSRMRSRPSSYAA